MASSNHHHSHHAPPITTPYYHHAPPITAPYYHPCCYTYTPSPPPPQDPFLHSIASHVLHHHPPPPQPQPHRHHQPEYHPPQIHKRKHHSRKNLHRCRDSDDEEEEETSLPIVSSLLRRIAALESSLRHHSPARFSLRDAAVRTIQTHFRAFLVRRSRTLRQLKDLAFIKSALNILKSSVSDSTHFDYHELSQETMRLLIKLESFKGGDPMVRDGKRSIKRELIQFLEFIDEVCLERQVLYSSRVVKNVGFGKNGAKSRVSVSDSRKRTVDSGGFGGDERKVLEKLGDRIQKIEKFSRVYEEGEEDNGGVENEGLSIDVDERKVLEKLRNRVQKMEERSRIYEEEEEEEYTGVGKKGLSMNANRNVSQTRGGALLKRQGLVQPKAKKNVSFVENGNVYRIIRSRDGPGSSGDSDSFDENDLVDGEKELMNNLCKEVEEIGISPKETNDREEDGTMETESTETSGDEKDHQRGNTRARDEYEIRKQIDQDEDDGFAFSAPLPVKMEARADLMNKKQPLRE